MIVAGFSAYSRVDRLRAIPRDRREVGAYLFVDMAHVAGLVAAGVYPNPIPHADFVTTTTHKTLRGPRGGMILARANDAITKKLNSLVFPGMQGGPLMHVIAAKAVAFLEALQPEFKEYQQQVVANARAMRRALQKRGYKIVSGGTDNHLFLLDLSDKAITGKEADAALGKAHITVNKNAVPNDPRPPMVTSGIRIGSPAVTTRGFSERSSSRSPTWSPTCSMPTAATPPSTRRARRPPSCAGGSRCTVRELAVRRLTRGRAMHCPFCAHDDTKVIDSRLAGRGRADPPPARVPGLRRALHHLRDRRAGHAAGGQDRPAPRAVRREQAARRHHEGAGEAPGVSARRSRKPSSTSRASCAASASARSLRGRSARS